MLPWYALSGLENRRNAILTAAIGAGCVVTQQFLAKRPDDCKCK